MQYQISYVSPAGHVEKLAEAFCGLFPADTSVVDLSCEESGIDAENHLIGFELTGNSDAIPYAVLEHLEQLEDKVILLFVTSPLEPSENLREKVESKITPFLPDNCDYRGIFICYGEVSTELMQSLRSIISEDPGNDRTQALLYSFNESLGHPDTVDVNNGISFLTEALELDI